MFRNFLLKTLYARFHLRHLSCLLLACVLMGCRDGKRYHDEKSDSESGVTETGPAAGRIPTTGLESIRAFQEQMNQTFSDPETSPLSGGALDRFEGLSFFPADTSYQVWAKLMRSPEALPFDMPTTTDRMARERKYGTLAFELQGRPFELQVYQSPELMLEEGYEDYLFLPFTDQTNGGSTYEGGRYLDLRIPEGDSLLLDFNRAYNPLCVYNPEYSCPIVPSVNHLDTEIRAGVRAYLPNENP